jgi:hypothetical protein
MRVRHPGCERALRHAGFGSAVAVAVAIAVACLLAQPARAEVSPSVTQNPEGASETKKIADAAVQAVNLCDPIRAQPLIARLKSIKETFDSEADPPTNVKIWREDLGAIIRVLELELRVNCGPHVVQALEATVTGKTDVSYAFFDNGNQAFASQQWANLVAAGKRCNEEEFVAAAKQVVDDLRRRAHNVEDPQQPSALPANRRAADAKALRRMADMINGSMTYLAYELCDNPLRMPRFGFNRGTSRPTTGSPPGQVPGMPGSPAQTQPVNYAFGGPNGSPPFVAVIEGGAYWHEVRKLLYGTRITQIGVPGTERGFLRSDESLSGGSLGLRVGVPGGVFGLSDDWRARFRLAGQWADGDASRTAEPGTINTARRYFVPAANGSTGLDYGLTGMAAHVETNFHRFGLDASLSRRFGRFQVNGGRVDLNAGFGLSYQYTHVGHDVRENNLTFPDIWSTAGFFSTDHVLGPHISGSAAYTDGPLRVSANLQFAPAIVFGRGRAEQRNVCGGCPAAEQDFTQTVSDSRTAFNARVLFGLHASYQLFPGLNIGGYFNLNYNSSASAWKFSPNPLKGPPTLRGSEDFGYGVGVKVTVLLR